MRGSGRAKVAGWRLIFLGFALCLFLPLLRRGLVEVLDLPEVPPLPLPLPQHMRSQLLVGGVQEPVLCIDSEIVRF